MLSVQVLARIALRYDTAMSRAMLRALGVPVPAPAPAPGTVAPVGAEPEVDPDVAWCFANRESPMDRLR